MVVFQRNSRKICRKPLVLDPTMEWSFRMSFRKFWEWRNDVVDNKNERILEKKKHLIYWINMTWHSIVSSNRKHKTNRRNVSLNIMSFSDHLQHPGKLVYLSADPSKLKYTSIYIYIIKYITRYLCLNSLLNWPVSPPFYLKLLIHHAHRPVSMIQNTLVLISMIRRTKTNTVMAIYQL